MADFTMLAAMTEWLIPVWTVSEGVALGLILAAAIYGALRLALPKVGVIIEDMALTGLLQPLFYFSLAPAAIAVIAFPWAPYEIAFKQIAAGLPLGADAKLLLGVAAFVLGLFLLSLFLRLVFPKVAAIALATSKEGMAQPLFWVCVPLGVFALLVFIWLPYNTFGEDIKMLKDSGLTLIMILSILLAIATASVSISQEIEGRTALTLLSKPISRRQFILGKYLGVLWPVLMMFVVLGFVFLGTVSYKVVYDGAESGRNLTYEFCREEMVQILPGLVLAFMQTMVLAAISVAISTRLPMLANMAICFMVYVLGNLVPLMVQSSAEKLQEVKFIGQWLAVVLPVLEHFNMQAAIAGGQPVPPVYLATAGVYCLLYVAFALLGALVLFEDRDLA